MLTITIPPFSVYDEATEKFISTTKTVTLSLEHSLVSISKWESNWQKPFFEKDNKSPEEMIDYIRCMTITQNVDPNTFYGIPSYEMDRIVEYIKSPQTATKLPASYNNNVAGRPKERVTAELIYYWMISYGIPVEFQKWHLNKLIALINIFNFKNQGQGPKKSAKELNAKYASINAKNRALMHSKG